MFKDKIKKLREKKEISQYELADKIFVSRSTIAKWENGLGMPSSSSMEALCNYFGVTKEELIDNNETESIIVKKNISISKMKKLIISLSTIICCLLIFVIVLLILQMPRSLSKQLNKLGDYEKVKIALYDNGDNEKYYLDENDESTHEIVLTLLNTIEYTYYPKYRRSVPEWLGTYSIILEGYINIIINKAFLTIDGINRAVKNYNSEIIDRIIELLINSESIEIMDEGFNY